MTKDYFTYDDGVGTVPAGAFRISASQLSKFFDQTSQWYREHLLGESGFTGSTASELGNCVHAAAAMYADTGEVDYEAIEQYIETLWSNPDVEPEVISNQYQPMIESLLSSYLESNVPSHSEEFIWKEILPGIGVGGSCDAYHDGEVRDYKTTSQTYPVKSFKREYYFQLMTYAWIYREMGRDVHTLKLIYTTRNNVGNISEKTGKPTKDYPSITYPLEHVITDADWQLIEGAIQVIAHSVQLWQSNPKMRWLLAQDARLRTKEFPSFKD